MPIKLALADPINLNIYLNRLMHSYVYVPYAFGYLKSYLDKYLPNQVEIKVIQSPKEILNDDYDLLGLSTYTPSYQDVLDFVDAVKNLRPDIPIFLGGHHITLLPHTLPYNIDFGVLGEGEETLKEIISKYINTKGKFIRDKDFEDIKGLVYRKEDKLFFTKSRDLLNIDSIPFMDQAILENSDSKIKPVFTSRGCPYKCSFCSPAIFWKKFRFNSADYVIKEIETILNNYPITEEIAFTDDLFVFDKNRLKLIKDMICKKGFNTILNFNCALRANFIDDEICIILKSMNIKRVFIGLEYGSNEILSKIKPQVTLEINQRALDLLYKYNIKVMASFILGIPGETEKTIEENYNFIYNNFHSKKLFKATFAILFPIPGTYFWNYAINKGYIDESNIDWNRIGNAFIPISVDLKDFIEWRKQREGYSLYLNKDLIPENRFYDILQQYFLEFMKFNFRL